MSIQGIKVLIRGYGQKKPLGKTLFKHFQISKESEYELKAGKSSWQASTVTFFMLEISDFEESEEPTAVFTQQLNAKLTEVSSWLMKFPQSHYDDFRSQGYKLDIFIGIWLDDEQFELDLPVEFLTACGHANLAVSIVSND